MHRPVSNYDTPSQQIPQASLSNSPENLQYAAEVPERRPAKPVYTESKDNGYIRNTQSLNLNRQELLPGNHYPSAERMDNRDFPDRQRPQSRTPAENPRTRIKSRPAHTNRHEQVIKGYYSYFFLRFS